MISADLILAATFVVASIFGATNQIRPLGTSIAIWVLLDTFPARTLLVLSRVTITGGLPLLGQSIKRSAVASRALSAVQ